MCSRRSWKAQRYTRDVACALHTFGTQKAFFTQRPHSKTNRLQLPEGRVAPSTVIYNNLASAVPWVWDEGGKIIRGRQPCDTPQQTSVLDAGTSVAQWWTQCKREKEKKRWQKDTLAHKQNHRILSAYTTTHSLDRTQGCWQNHG